MRARLTLDASSLRQTFAFYSALDVEWIGGEDRAVDLPDVESIKMGLPSLWAKFGELELMFYSAPNVPRCAGAAPVLLLSYESDKQVHAVLKRLDKAGMLQRHTECSKSGSHKLIDPDGRVVELAGPSLLDFCGA